MEKQNDKVFDCIFVTDIHGDITKYRKLFEYIRSKRPMAVFIGGDILPNMKYIQKQSANFIEDFLIKEFKKLKSEIKNNYPKIFIIFGNDDPKIEESKMLFGENEQLWYYIHDKQVTLNQFTIIGYSFVPPTPFLLKDWEKYDVSRHIDPGCISPEEGYRTEIVEQHIIKYDTIKKDLSKYCNSSNLDNTIFLFHSPPYKCNLDRAALDNKFIDHVPLTVNVGSIAIKEFIEKNQPLLTLHGHIHESYSLTGEWKEQFGKTMAFTAAHNGSELAIVKFNLLNLLKATREHI